MPNLVQKWKMMDGPSHVTLHVYLASDGQSGDLLNYVLLDPATELVPSMPRRQDLIVKQVWFEFGGFTATLLFNATSPWPFWELTGSVGLQHDWRFFGGIRDRSDAAGFGLSSDGKLLLSTTGFTDVSNKGALVLWMEKRDRPNPQPD